MAVRDVSVRFVTVRRKATNLRRFLILLSCRARYTHVVRILLSCRCAYRARIALMSFVPSMCIVRPTKIPKKTHVSAACMCHILVTYAKNVRWRSMCLLPKCCSHCVPANRRGCLRTVLFSVSWSSLRFTCIGNRNHNALP